MSATFPLQLDFLNHIVLSQNIVYVPIPKEDYYQMQYIIDQNRKQIDILKKENNNLKQKNFKLLKNSKCEKQDEIQNIDSLLDLLNLFHELEKSDIMTD
jgi:hypothetical protein